MGCAGSKARVAAEARVAEVARLAKEARALEKPLVKTAEQLTADAELTELRRLTPEQEAAAAKAAQRIGEVAAVAPEEERGAATFDMVEPSREQWDCFGGGAIEPLLDHTPLIDLEYLVALAEGDGVMPCGRQNVPPAALWCHHIRVQPRTHHTRGTLTSVPGAIITVRFSDSAP